MYTCIESTRIYAVFRITDNFFKYLWRNVFNHMLNFSLALKNCAWFVGIGYTLDVMKPLKKKLQGVGLQDLGGYSSLPWKDITLS